MHNCGFHGAILPIVILIVTIWDTIFSARVNYWIIIVAATLILLHAIGCKSCKMGMYETKPVRARAVRKKVVRRKKRK